MNVLLTLISSIKDFMGQRPRVTTTMLIEVIPAFTETLGCHSEKLYRPPRNSKFSKVRTKTFRRGVNESSSIDDDRSGVSEICEHEIAQCHPRQQKVFEVTAGKSKY